MRTAVLVCLLALQDTPSSEWLAIGPLPSGGRSILVADPVMDRIFRGELPREGDSIGNRTWKKLKPDASGTLADGTLQNGVAFARIPSDRDRVVVAAVRGASSLILNGEMFVGDPYALGTVRVPLPLQKGDNHLFARSIRGLVSIKFEDPAAPVMINPLDATLPDLVEGESIDAWAAVPVVNTTLQTVRGAVLQSGSESVEIPALAPLAILKVPFRVRSGPELSIKVTWQGQSHEHAFTMRSRKKGESFKRTFVSAIDESVQYFSVLPPANFDSAKEYALVLSLHGAGVEAFNQAAAYSPKEWAVIVAPTNRRPFGFDWEDWGRLDALEVLDLAMRQYKIDPARVYLTGHSMGGHGTWQTAVQFTDRFAAAAPSAGWISFFTYAGRPPNYEGDMGKLFYRAMAPSDTLKMIRNLEPLPLFVIHGDQDDDVPVDQSRRMIKELEAFHRKVTYHEEKGAGHWWDKKETPGADCVNLSSLFDFFKEQRRIESPDSIDFATLSPAVSSRRHWVEVLGQIELHMPSRVQAQRSGDRIVVKTENVSDLKIHLKGTAEIDGTVVSSPAEIHRTGERWTTEIPSAGLRKTPARYGPFKQAFHRPFLLVYGSAGSEEETRAALAKARYDAQVWWYRGNGLGRVLADTDVTPELGRSHNLILYGNERSNLCWKNLAPQLPVVSTQPGRLEMAGRAVEGDVAFTLLYPSPASPEGFVALVGETGPGGRRAWWAGGWFLSGAGLPDMAVWDTGIFSKGLGGVRAAGFFGMDWKPDPHGWVEQKPD